MQDMKQYKILSEHERPIYHSASLTKNAALFLLQVEQIYPSDISGHLYNLYMPEAESFSSIAEAIMKMDCFMNEIDYPQATTELRDIHYTNEKKNYMEYLFSSTDSLPQIMQYWMPTIFSHPVDCLVNIFIRVLYRQNSSWQGTILWLGQDGLKREVHFRSVLELIHIIQSAITATNYVLLELKGFCHEKSHP